ncbi:hypothetical protein L6164_004586 [Bauhinia variegata]|uniref:Uncharacterized protein n=1 Tax=Bauhinia variegata TaxID=167791 RepID=A0ACB9Q6E3_BAUVA|nr:hypothetical protein L6164_004586 [Bauhinia variegata]
MVLLGTLFFLFLQYQISTLTYSLVRHYPPYHSLQTDKAALLEFKRTITHDPYSTLANWDEAVHVCNFTGVRCGNFQHRVKWLILEDKHLVGLLPPFLSNLTGLQSLHIVNSHLYGIVPPEFSSLKRLRSLQLDGNNLHGSIPDSLSQLPKLKTLHVSGNNISGSLSPSLFRNCTELEIVDLSSNFLAVCKQVATTPFPSSIVQPYDES